MARARYEVLVIPYRIDGERAQFCVFKRSDMEAWQFIAGGGEETDSSILDAAKREAFEEAGIPATSDYCKLDTCCSIPANCFQNAEALWGKECFVIPEYVFAVKAEKEAVRLSHEHTMYRWMTYAEARGALTYDSNKTALWELNQRIQLGMLK